MSGETDVALLRDLRRLLASGAVRLDLDAAKLNHMDSPVAVQAEVNRWLVPMIAACGGAFWFFGWVGAAAALSLSAATWFAWARPALRRRVERRVYAAALDDVQTWRKLWRFGGLQLVAGDAVCAAPSGNWMQFVRDYRPASP